MKAHRKLWQAALSEEPVENTADLDYGAARVDWTFAAITDSVEHSLCLTSLDGQNALEASPEINRMHSLFLALLLGGDLEV